jgi:hypothetical protein
MKKKALWKWNTNFPAFEMTSTVLLYANSLSLLNYFFPSPWP